jgi:hypothetical protein
VRASRRFWRSHLGHVEIQGEKVDVRCVLEYGHNAPVQRFEHYVVVAAVGDVGGVPTDDTDGAHRLPEER